jgi:hypothetical protein
MTFSTRDVSITSAFFRRNARRLVKVIVCDTFSYLLLRVIKVEQSILVFHVLVQKFNKL